MKQIQLEVVDGESPIGPMLLKLRLLAARLGSDILEEWVKHEMDGYNSATDVPDYRKIAVSYRATFSGPFGSAIKNAPIPPYIIEDVAGDHWNNYALTDSIAEVDQLVSTSKSGEGSLTINAANLILLLQGNVYEGYACNSVVGNISTASLVGIQNAVRSRVLELSLQLEKSVPAASDIKLDSGPSDTTTEEPKLVSQITNNVVYGDMTQVSNSGSIGNIDIKITKNDDEALLKKLITSGLPENDANELVEIVKSETPEGTDEPFGTRARKWIFGKLGDGAAATWKMGNAAATSLLTEYLKQYYGLK